MDETKATNVFLSWSKNLAKEIAVKFRDDLEFIFGSRVTIFFSPDDIKSGQKAFNEINRQLNVTNYGVFIITEENKSAPWIFYEAGAIAKDEKRCRVMVMLAGVGNDALQDTPLQQYQNCRLCEEGYKKIFMDIYELCSVRDKESTVLERISARWKENCREYEELMGTYVQTPENTVQEKNTYVYISGKLNDLQNLIRESKYAADFDKLIENQNELLRLVQELKRTLDSYLWIQSVRSP